MLRQLVGWGLLLAHGCHGASDPERSATRRLTSEEWRNTVRDLVGVQVDQSALPIDELIAGFPNNVAAAVGEFDAELYLGAAELAATEASIDVAELLGCSERTRACAASWAPGFLERAFRRPVTLAEVARLLEVYDVGPTHHDGVRMMVTAALVSGSFLYRPEVGGERQGARVQLDGFEMASRLSYLLWRSMPDEALFEAARRGELSTADQVASQASRMLQDRRAGDGLASFHADWLGVANFHLLDRYRDLLEETQVSLESQPLRDWTVVDADGLPMAAGTLKQATDREEPAIVVDGDHAGLHAYHGVELGPVFKITGRFVAQAEGGEVGLTFLSGGPQDGRDFELRKGSDGGFTLASALCHEQTPWVIPDGQWTSFEISGLVDNLQTTIRLRLWPTGDDPLAERPIEPSLTCRDASTRRGSVALWASGPGAKAWAALQVVTETPVEFDFGPRAEAYAAETRAFLAAWGRNGGSLHELFTADWTMANEAVAGVYGLPNIHGPELVRVSLPPERVGILTQPLFLSTFAKPNQSSPVQRGMAVRSHLLCEVLAPPPPDVNVVPPEPSDDATTREQFAAHTEDPACAGCHVRMDPVGFGFEGFDQFGVWRTEQNGLPVDTSGEIVAAGTATGSFDDVRGLVELLVESDELRACMARNWYRYAMAHLEDPQHEDPALTEALWVCSDDDCRVEEIVHALVTADSFRFRARHDGDDR